MVNERVQHWLKSHEGDALPLTLDRAQEVEDDLNDMELVLPSWPLHIVINSCNVDITDAPPEGTVLEGMDVMSPNPFLQSLMTITAAALKGGVRTSADASTRKGGEKRDEGGGDKFFLWQTPGRIHNDVVGHAPDDALCVRVCLVRRTTPEARRARRRPRAAAARRARRARAARTSRPPARSTSSPPSPRAWTSRSLLVGERLGGPHSGVFGGGRGRACARGWP